jgi:hypothetical protein
MKLKLRGTNFWKLIHLTKYQKHIRSFKMYCWKGMEKINWHDHVRDEVVINRIKKNPNNLHAIKRGKANWSGHILRVTAF